MKKSAQNRYTIEDLARALQKAFSDTECFQSMKVSILRLYPTPDLYLEISKEYFFEFEWFKRKFRIKYDTQVLMRIYEHWTGVNAFNLEKICAYEPSQDPFLDLLEKIQRENDLDFEMALVVRGPIGGDYM